MDRKKGPLYLFLGYYIPDYNVIHLMADARKLFPEARVMIRSLSNVLLPKHVMAQQPAALISKAAKVSGIVACLAATEKKEVYKVYISSGLKGILQKETATEGDVDFRAKEIDIPQYIAQGKNSQQTADMLHISRNTVITHRRNMMARVDCHSVTELWAFGRETGLVLTGK